MLYYVEFPDGKIKEYSTNVIANNVYAQVDAEGRVHNIMTEILDFKKDESDVDKEYMYITTNSGQRHIQKNFGMENIGSME